MLILSRELLKTIIAHCRQESPNEACGILAGANGKVKKAYKMTNTDKSPSSYFMEPRQQLAIQKEIRKANLEMAAIYHSHPVSEAYPSSHDVELAFYPEVSYIIISLKDKNNPEVRSFKIINGRIEEEIVKIV